MILFLILTAAVIVGDQLTKLWAVAALKGGEEINVLPGFLRFTYVENRGAAFGMMSDNRWIFMVLSTVALVAIIIYMLKFKPKYKTLILSLGFLAGGGIANMIDRFRLGYVIDFIDFTFIKFYVFNLADSFVCVGCGFMILYVILTSLEEKKKKKAENGDGGDSSDE